VNSFGPPDPARPGAQSGRQVRITARPKAHAPPSSAPCAEWYHAAQSLCKHLRGVDKSTSLWTSMRMPRATCNCDTLERLTRSRDQRPETRGRAVELQRGDIMGCDVRVGVRRSARATLRVKIMRNAHSGYVQMPTPPCRGWHDMVGPHMPLAFSSMGSPTPAQMRAQ